MLRGRSPVLANSVFPVTLWKLASWTTKMNYACSLKEGREILKVRECVGSSRTLGMFTHW